MAGSMYFISLFRDCDKEALIPRGKNPLPYVQVSKSDYKMQHKNNVHKKNLSKRRGFHKIQSR